MACVQTIRSQYLRGVLDSVQVPPAPCHFAIALPFGPFADSGNTRGMMGEIVILVDGDNGGGGIHELSSAPACVPQNIVVPGVSSNRQRKKSVADAARINKIVDVVPRALVIYLQCLCAHGFRP